MNIETSFDFHQNSISSDLWQEFIASTHPQLFRIYPFSQILNFSLARCDKRVQFLAGDKMIRRSQFRDNPHPIILDKTPRNGDVIDHRPRIIEPRYK